MDDHPLLYDEVHEVPGYLAVNGSIHPAWYDDRTGQVYWTDHSGLDVLADPKLARRFHASRITQS